MMSPSVFSDTSNYSVTYTEKLQQRITNALIKKGVSYKARTRFLHEGQPIYTNRLILEESPYLLQHAHNPVNWFAWGKEAFAIAKQENKPIFLSIGYATCHWCHVMEEESFENIQVAEILNEHFIAIKVDREQHPDIDATYMEAVQLLTGRGGWPMSSFITGEGKPFFGGTYFPQPTFVNLLLQVNDAWNKQYETLHKQANKLANAVQKRTSRQGDIALLEQSAVDLAVQQALGMYDSQNGGFSGTPKFPQEPLLLLLLQMAERQHDPQILKALNHTLSVMSQGGIYDQVGGGFHRYSTDAKWLVPHFEKMLYNQAYLVRVYLRAYRLTHNPLYARIVKQTLDYVLREMSSTHGTFYSASDADSEGEEGTYFVWTLDEIKELLSPSDALFIIRLFGVTQNGNFEAKNIFFLDKPLTDSVLQQGDSLDKLLARLDPLLEILRKHRQKKIAPLTDNKVIVAWNGMLITALTEAGDVLNAPRYIQAAKKAAVSLWKLQRPEENVLWRINLDGKSSITAKQADYVHFSEALITLYDVTADQSYLDKAIELTHEMVDNFNDASSGTLRMGTTPLLFTQPKDTYDSTLPSGNAVAVRVFSKLFQRTGKDQYYDYASKILQAFSNDIMRQAIAYPYMLAQLEEREKGEISAHQYAARGAIKVDAEIESLGSGQFKINIHFKIKPDWHINSHQPIQSQLIATNITMENNTYWQLGDIQYPKPKLIKTKFVKGALSLFLDDFNITANLLAKSSAKIQAIKINLTLQACNQSVCLAPESLTLFLSIPF